MLVAEVVTQVNEFWTRLGAHEVERMELRSAGFIDTSNSNDLLIKSYLASRFSQANQHRNLSDQARLPSGVSSSSAETFLNVTLNQVS